MDLNDPFYFLREPLGVGRGIFDPGAKSEPIKEGRKLKNKKETALQDGVGVRFQNPVNHKYCNAFYIHGLLIPFTATDKNIMDDCSYDDISQIYQLPYKKLNEFFWGYGIAPEDKTILWEKVDKKKIQTRIDELSREIDSLKQQLSC